MRAPLNIAPSPSDFIVPDSDAVLPPSPPVSGLLGWWRASDLVLAVPNLTYWSDASPAGNDLQSYPIGSLDPQVVINSGIQAVQFQPGENAMSTQLHGPVWVGSAQRTMIAVWKNLNPAANSAICGQPGNGDDDTMFGFLAPAGNALYLGGYNHDIDAQISYSNAWTFAIATYNGGSNNAAGVLHSNQLSFVYNFNNPPGVFSTPLNTSTEHFYLGYDQLLGWTSDICIAEIICYDRVLSATEITTIKTYFLNKFGIVSV